LGRRRAGPKKPRLLLHVCCAPCGTYVSRDRLAPEYDLTWYFYNPNLSSQEEYNKRLEAVKLVARQYGWPLIIEPYEHKSWLKMVRGREDDPERGARCMLCYRDRLVKTARLARRKKFNYFGTTLLTSPYKDSAAILSMGRELGEKYQIDFLDQDFQADNGYSKSQSLAKELGLYRQKFCGCEYSCAPSKKS
jgi:predicted adenine nucleotide alpha hydrolase (AANH) superfamily ATPase